MENSEAQGHQSVASRLDVVSWTCFVWPVQCSEYILISCQSHEISHKNVDFRLFLRSRRPGCTGPHYHPGTIDCCGELPALPGGGPFSHSLPCSLLPHPWPPGPLAHLRYWPCPTPVRPGGVCHWFSPEPWQSSTTLAYNFRKPRKCAVSVASASDPVGISMMLGSPMQMWYTLRGATPHFQWPAAATLCLNGFFQNEVDCPGRARHRRSLGNARS